MEINSTVGRRIRRLREELGLSREQVARKVGVCQQQIHKYETGQNGVSIARLTAIAKVLGVEVGYFLK